MMVNRSILLLGLSLIPAVAQTPPQRLYDHNIHSWIVYAGDHPVAGPWGLHLEAQLRRHDAGVQPQQLLLRPAVNYQLSPRVGLSAGYAYVTTHRYGEYPVQATFPEHRIYQQAILQHKAGCLEFLHRLRMEQRWLGQRILGTAGQQGDRTWRYQNRFRYMLRLVVPVKKGPWYFASSNELFLNYAPTHGARAFDQNRAFVGIGNVIGKETRVEAGYMQQTLLQRNARVLELNHTIQVAVFSRLPFVWNGRKEN